jgi:hypothetical protein
MNASQQKKILFFVLLVVFFSVVMASLGVKTWWLLSPTVILAEREEESPLSPSSPEWQKAPAIVTALASPAEKTIRTTTVRAFRDSKNLYLLLEWTDPSQDTSFFGNPDWFPSNELFRDAAAIAWISEQPVPGPHPVLSAGKAPLGWMWSSHWQYDYERKPFAEVLARYTEEFVDYYPEKENPIFFPSRALGNNNAIIGANSPVRFGKPGWVVLLKEPKGGELFGVGEWHSGVWKLMFVCPLDSPVLPRNTGEGSMNVFGIQVWDGGKLERKRIRALSRPIFLENVPVKVSPVQGGDSR